MQVVLKMHILLICNFHEVKNSCEEVKALIVTMTIILMTIMILSKLMRMN